MDGGFGPLPKEYMASAYNQPVPSPQPSSAIASSSGTADGVIYPSAARTAATYTSDEMFNPVCKGVRVYIDITADGGGTVTASLQSRDPNSDKWVTITGATTAALATATQTRTLTLYPGIAAAAGSATTNTEVSAFLSVSWRVVIVVATATVTFSVGAEYLL